MKKAVIILSILTSLTGCATSSHYREPAKSQPYAMVLFEKTKGIEYALTSRQIVYPLEINGLPINNLARWDLVDFRVPSGTTKLLVLASVDRGVQGMGFLKFNAVAGEEYSVTAQSLDESFMIYVKDKALHEIAKVEAKKALSPPSNPTFVPIFIPAR